MTEFTHKELVMIAYRWVLKNASCGVAFRELVSGSSNETPDVIGFGAWEHSVLVECKVTRIDFLADKKKRCRVQPETGMGKALLKYRVRVPDPAHVGRFTDYKHERNVRAEMGLMYSGLRRLHLRRRIEEIYDDNH